MLNIMVEGYERISASDSFLSSAAEVDRIYHNSTVAGWHVGEQLTDFALHPLEIGRPGCAHDCRQSRRASCALRRLERNGIMSVANLKFNALWVPPKPIASLQDSLGTDARVCRFLSTS